MRVIDEHYGNTKSGQIGSSDVPLIQRAITAHIRSSRSEQLVQPRLVQHVEDDGKEYIVLWYPGFRDRLLSVYRVRAYDGVLRIMKRPPAGLSRELADRIVPVS